MDRSAVMNTYQEEEDYDEEDEEEGEDERGAVGTATGAFKRPSMSPDLQMDFDRTVGVGGVGDEMLHSGGMVSDAASLLFTLGGAKE
jgi:hypothetical protein